MTSCLVFLAGVLFVMAGTALWGTIVDGTVHRAPSEWLSSVYLGVFVGLLGSAGMLLDQIRSHLFLAGIVGVAVFAMFIGITVLLWARVKKLDEAYHAKRGHSHSGF